MAEFNHKNKYAWKYVNEEFDIEYSFANDIDSSDSLSSATVTCEDAEGTDTSSSMISNINVSSPKVTFTIKAGTADNTYQIKLVGTTTNSKIITHYITLDVFGSITLNTKLGNPNANSYITLKEANDYVKNKRGHSSTWDSLSFEGKKRVLIQACKDINRYNFVNPPYYDIQSLSFPDDDHKTESNSVSTPLDNTTIKSSDFSDSTYGEEKSYNNYWKYGTLHITNATPLNDIRNIATSNFLNDVVHLSSPLSATPTTNTKFRIFAPLDDNIKNAQIEQALYIIESGRKTGLEGYRDLGVQEVRIGDVRVDFKRGASLKKISVSPTAYKLISRWIRRGIYAGRA